MLRPRVPCSSDSYSFVSVTKSIKPRVVNAILGSCGFRLFFLEVYDSIRAGWERVRKNFTVTAYHVYGNSSTVIKTSGNSTWSVSEDAFLYTK